MSERMYLEARRKQKMRADEESKQDFLGKKRNSFNQNATNTPRVASRGHFTASPRASNAKRRTSSPNRARSTPVSRPFDERFSESSVSRKSFNIKKRTPNSDSRTESPVSINRHSTTSTSGSPRARLKPSPNLKTGPERRPSTSAVKRQTPSHMGAQHYFPSNGSRQREQSPRTTRGPPPASSAQRGQQMIRGISLDSQKSRGSRDSQSSNGSSIVPSPIRQGKKRASQISEALPVTLEDLVMPRSQSIDDEVMSPEALDPDAILGFMAADSPKQSRPVPHPNLSLKPRKSILKLEAPAAAEGHGLSAVNFDTVVIKEYPRIVLEDEDGDVELTIDWPEDPNERRVQEIGNYENMRINQGRIIAKNFKSKGQEDIRQLADEGMATLLRIGEDCYFDDDSDYESDDEVTMDPDNDPEYEELREFLDDNHLIQYMPAIAKLGVVEPRDLTMLRVTVHDLTSVGVKLLAARQVLAKSGGNNAVSATRFALHGPASRDSQLKKLGLKLGRKLTSKD